MVDKNVEIEKKNKELELQKQMLEQSYKDMKLLNDIAQAITSNLLAETIIDTVYENVSSLMKSTVFGIGVLNKKLNRLDFFGAYENGLKLPFFYNELTDDNRLAVWCFKNKSEIMILDYFTEYKKFIPQIPIPKAGENTQSLLYAPLIVKDKIIGVITVQSFKKFAYTDYHIDILKNIANHTAIALENAESYMKIEKQNADIESYNIELEMQKKEIQAQADNLMNANLIITEKNKILTLLNDEKDKYLAWIDQELNQAAEYVVSLIPDPMEDKNIKISWKFVPSTQLGGDAFGYHYHDAEHLAIYLLDVCGHGIGPALHSISVLNTLKFETLPLTDFRNPTEVMKNLNKVYQMSEHNDMYFTLWYGVFNTRTRELKYAGAGHPPAVIINSMNKSKSLLSPSNIFIGGLSNYKFNSKSHHINGPSSLYVYSDGVFEIKKNNSLIWGIDELLAYITSYNKQDPCELDNLFAHIQNMQESEKLSDDFSIMKIEFK
jgi:serine phosphatase RsbU (regulator of sigma subunit)